MDRNTPLISTLAALFCLYGLLVGGAAWEQMRGRQEALRGAQLSIERQTKAIGEEIDRTLDKIRDLDGVESTVSSLILASKFHR